MTSIKKNYKTLELKLQIKENENENLNKALETAREQNDAIVAQLNATIENLNTELEELRKSVVQPDANMAQLNATIKNLNNELRDARVIVAQLEAAATDLKNTREQNNATVAQLNETIENLNTELEELRKSVVQPDATIAQLNVTIENLNKALETARKQNNVQVFKLATANAKTEQATKEIETLMRERDALFAEVTASRTAQSAVNTVPPTASIIGDVPYVYVLTRPETSATVSARAELDAVLASAVSADLDVALDASARGARKSLGSRLAIKQAGYDDDAEDLARDYDVQLLDIESVTRVTDVVTQLAAHTAGASSAPSEPNASASMRA